MALIIAYDLTGPNLVLYRYDPAADTWSHSTAAGIPSFRYDPLVLWTENRLLVWGGSNGPNLGDGAMYSPATDTWSAIGDTDAPVPRDGPLGVWTGTKAIAWGGECADTSCWTGGLLDVSGNSWAPIAKVSDGAPLARKNMAAASDGARAYIWGGGGTGGYYRVETDGGIYDPGTDKWIPINNIGAPNGRYGPTAFAYAGRLAVFGGSPLSGSADNGGIYDSTSGSWVLINTPPWSDARLYYTTAFAGNKLVVWGGQDSAQQNTGFVFDLSSHNWQAMSVSGAPSARTLALAVGHLGLIYVYGGSGATGGGVYDAAHDSWAAFVESGDIPTGDITAASSLLLHMDSHLLIWSQAQQVAWIYDLSTQSWHQSSMSGHVADTVINDLPSLVWSGKEALFFGGSGQTQVDGQWIENGWAYDPTTDHWRSLEMSGLGGRQLNAGVMVGSKMIIWGGGYNDGYADPTYTGASYCATDYIFRNSFE